MANLKNKRKLLRRMARMPVEARKEIRKALETSAEEMADVAKRFAPRESGALARSIDYTFGAYKAANANVRAVGGYGGLQDKDLTVTIHAGDSVAWYAALVEYGTPPHAQPNNPRIGYHHPGASPQPFFMPAYRLIKKRVRSRISRAINRAAKKAANG